MRLILVAGRTYAALTSQYSDSDEERFIKACTSLGHVPGPVTHIGMCLVIPRPRVYWTLNRLWELLQSDENVCTIYGLGKDRQSFPEAHDVIDRVLGGHCET